MNLPTVVAGDEDEPEFNLTQNVVTRRMKHFNKVLSDFWKRWRNKYLLKLRDAHGNFQAPRGAIRPILVGDVVILQDDDQPRGQWNLAIVQELIDGEVRSTTVKTHSRGGRTEVTNSKIVPPRSTKCHQFKNHRRAIYFHNTRRC